MKTTTEPMFSNASEFMSWSAVNCERCVKWSKYNEATDTYTAFKCSIDRDINAQIIGLHEVSQRSFDVTQESDCPHIKSEHKKSFKKRVIKNQLQLELEL